MRRKRHRVATRAKVRDKRVKQGGAVLAMAALGALAAATLRNAARELPSRQELSLWADRGFAVRVSGAPLAVEEGARALLEDREAVFDARVARLLAKFPFIKAARLRRNWLSRTAVFELETRRAFGRAEGGRYFGDDGELFRAPAGLYPAPLPLLELSGADSASRKALAECLEFMSKDARAPRVSGMRFISSQEGWRATLEDGTSVQWGALNWTGEKLSRLREVMEDARGRGLERISADLRYFEDGKILLRQVR